MASLARKTRRYPSDMVDDELERIAPLMLGSGCRSRPWEVAFREVINAVRYPVRSGCGWRMLADPLRTLARGSCSRLFMTLK